MGFTNTDVPIEPIDLVQLIRQIVRDELAVSMDTIAAELSRRERSALTRLRAGGERQAAADQVALIESERAVQVRVLLDQAEIPSHVTEYAAPPACPNKT